MTDWQLSKDGVIDGLIRLDMTVEEVKNTLGAEGDAFERTSEAPSEIFAFDDHGIHTVIDRDRRVAGLIVFPPNRVWIARVQLLRQPTVEIGQKLREAGFAFESDEVGLWSGELRVALIDVDGLVDGVQIGISG